MANPREVEITEVSKRGEWYSVKGRTRDGRTASVDIPAASIEVMSREKSEALMRRSVLGTILSKDGSD